MHTCIMSNFSFTLKKLKLKYSNNLRNRKFNNQRALYFTNGLIITIVQSYFSKRLTKKN